MVFTTRQRIEADIYDKKAIREFSHLDERDLIVDGECFPFPNREHIDFCTYAISRLGPLADKKLLECGSASGKASVYFARQGATVSGVDISKEQTAAARRRAKANGIEVDFRVMPVEALDFPDAHFDAIFGNQVLHHLDLVAAAPELRRVLKGSGKALFCEPVFFLGSLLGRLRRTALGERIFPRERDTPTEDSLTMEALSILENNFDEVLYKEFQVLTRIQKWITISDRSYLWLSRVDQSLLRRSRLVRRRLPRFLVIELS